MIFLALLLQLFSFARADILFLDTNFSPAEVTAAQVAAKTRGEKLWVFPERTPEQHRAIEQQYRVQLAALNRLKACSIAGKSDCAKESRAYMEAGERLNALTSALRKLDGAELDRILAIFENAGVKLSTVVFSGHGGGEGSVVGILGTLHAKLAADSFSRFPAVLAPVRAILLWGCYGGTLYSLNGVWGKLFPSVAVWGGFSQQSPLGIRETSGRFLKSFLLAEKKMAETRDGRALHRLFRSLDLVADLDGTAIANGFYLTYDAINSVEEMLARCQRFDGSLVTKFECYENGEAGCENPPADHRGPLRELYSFLQVNRHCEATLREKFPGLPSVEYLIRLIFLGNVKKNFEKHHRHEFPAWAEHVEALGLPPEVRAEKFVTSTRAEDVAGFRLLDRYSLERGVRDGSFVTAPDWHDLMVLSTVRNGLGGMLGPSGVKAFPFSCVPFTWIEPDAAEKDGCRFGLLLRRPMGEELEGQFLSQLFQQRIQNFSYARNLEALVFPPPSLTNMKNIYRGSLLYLANALQSYSERSALEEKRLADLRARLAESEPWNDRQVAQKILDSIPATLEFLAREKEDARRFPRGEAAVNFLRMHVEQWEAIRASLTKMLEESR